MRQPRATPTHAGGKYTLAARGREGTLLKEVLQKNQS